jgi:hypothetical protein
MCRAGGPRCDGKRKASTNTSSTTTTTATATATVPSRADADRLGAELAADRKGWDGSPLSEKDRRFYALRESGWTGPIDQDGYADTTSDQAAALRHMATKRGETVNW